MNAIFKQDIEALETAAIDPISRVVDAPVEVPGLRRVNQAASFSDNPWRRLRWLFLLAGDLISIVLSAGIGWVFASSAREMFNQPAFSSSALYPTLLMVLALPIVLQVWFASHWGHYTRFKSFWTEAREQTQITIYYAAATFGILFLLKLHLSRLWIIGSIACLLVLSPLMRILAKKTMTRLGIWFKPLIVIGTGKNAENCASTISKDLSMGYQLAEVITLSKKSELAPESDARYRSEFVSCLDAHQFIMQVAANYQNPHILYALENLDDFVHYNALLDRLTMQNSNVIIAPPVAGIPLTGTQIVGVVKHDSVFLRLNNNLKQPFARACKRLLDISAASLLILLLSPLLTGIYLLLSRGGQKPVFSHKRIGKTGKPFNCYKFRTMVPDADQVLKELLATDLQARAQWKSDFKLKNDPRITRLGKFLRETSLDELPQLWNVVLGEMSLVGPRPIVAEEIDRYGESIEFYTATWPGMTGIWQTSGRNNLSYAERVSLDVWYVRNWSFWQDIVVLLKTLPIFVRKSGSY